MKERMTLTPTESGRDHLERSGLPFPHFFKRKSDVIDRIITQRNNFPRAGDARQVFRERHDQQLSLAQPGIYFNGRPPVFFEERQLVRRQIKLQNIRICFVFIQSPGAVIATIDLRDLALLSNFGGVTLRAAAIFSCLLRNVPNG